MLNFTVNLDDYPMTYEWIIRVAEIDGLPVEHWLERFLDGLRREGKIRPFPIDQESCGRNRPRAA